jgi:transcriptional regulator with XRE-family HTH domain
VKSGKRPRKRRKTKTGALLRKARESKKLSLNDVSRETGLQGGGISHIENGRSIPTIKTAIILCTFYGLPISKLIEAVKEDEL